MRRQLSLATFDGRLLNGFEFCRKVYDLFEQVRTGSDGVRNLRLRPTKNEKRLIEELIPIARYVQARYSEGRRIKVRWFSGSQQFDGVLLSAGGYVDKKLVAKREYVEVTTAVHRNDHLARRLVHEKGHAWNVRGITQGKKTGKIDSKPYVSSSRENSSDLARMILDCLKSKSGKNYPVGTILVIRCVPTMAPLDTSEWEAGIKQVKEADVHRPFREVFVFDSGGPLSATLCR